VQRRIHLGISPDITSPLAAGFAHPMVLLPLHLVEAPPADVHRVLHHELAHLIRHDDWTNLAQQALRAVLFFHPTVLWLSRRLTLDREIACDDHVLAASGKARDYALFLTDFARQTTGRTWTAAPAAYSNPSQLKERIHMILDSTRNASPRLARVGAATWIAALALIATLGLQAAPRIALAGTSTADLAPDQPPVAAFAPDAAPPTPPAPPAIAAVPPTPPRPPGPEESIENRIERLERMVESLARKPGSATSRVRTERYEVAPRTPAVAATTTEPSPHTPPNPPHGPRYEPKAGLRLDADKLRHEIETTVRTTLDNLPNLESMNRIMAEVGRQVEQASREAERAVREALASAKASAQNPDSSRTEAIEQRRRALAEERRALQKQIARVESQLGRLDGELDKVDDLLDHQAEAAEASKEARRATERLRAKAAADEARAHARSAGDKARTLTREQRTVTVESHIGSDGKRHDELILRTPDGKVSGERTVDVTVDVDVDRDTKPASTPPAKTKDTSGDPQPASKEPATR
jgi:hypothetical protein